MRSTAILVSWRPPPPDTHNGALVGYSVRYRPLGSDDPEPKEVNGIPPTTTQILLEALEKWTEYRITAVAHTEEMVITNLEPETAYSITVAAYTMKGDGARSKPKVVVTKGAVLGRPTLTVQQTSEGSLLARWEPPPGVPAEDQVLGYRLQFGREDATPLATLEFPASEDHYTAAGVHKGATYVFRLAARSRGGLGEEAAEVLSIPEDAPRGHPQILEAAGNASAGTVLLRWLPPGPAERNGVIVKYTVAVREAGALGPPRETELPAAAEPGAENTLTLRGLKPDVAYDLQVRAHTRRGPGPYSPPVRYRTFLRDQGRRGHPASQPDPAPLPPR
ncbi:Receptor-type tyrosine-protein phosphatase S [Fukomys damarensis]|uniref:Receptor-type tyrosine-protein phosphatase S n=1 Tax=Fukomys damarensis TaxID=885580 RepID=A0A091DCM2_FUKDA|nr:Receptor-type tyrosine-protein phosphatase S [Fukomys damarensis]